MTRFEAPQESNDGGHDHGAEQQRGDAAESGSFAVAEPTETPFSVSSEVAVEPVPSEGAFATSPDTENGIHWVRLQENIPYPEPTDFGRRLDDLIKTYTEKLEQLRREPLLEEHEPSERLILPMSKLGRPVIDTVTSENPSETQPQGTMPQSAGYITRLWTTGNNDAVSQHEQYHAVEPRIPYDDYHPSPWLRPADRPRLYADEEPDLPPAEIPGLKQSTKEGPDMRRILGIDEPAAAFSDGDNGDVVEGHLVDDSPRFFSPEDVELIKDILNAQPLPTLEVNDDGTVTEISPTQALLHRFTREEPVRVVADIINKPTEELPPPADAG